MTANDLREVIITIIAALVGWKLGELFAEIIVSCVRDRWRR